MAGAERPGVAIAGGGLAGLTCALSLGRAGFDVTVYESTPRLGGKAGVRPERDLLQPGREFPLPVEHGPHFVAGWYLNLLALLRELGSAGRLVEYPGLRYLLPAGDGAELPREVDMPASARALPKLVAGHLGDPGDGHLTWRVSLQLASMAFDLLTHYERIEETEDSSLAQFMRSRWYGDEALAATANDQVLRASAIPADEVSLHTMATLMSLWFRYPKPFLSVFDTDLVSVLIDPLAAAVEEVAEVRLGEPILGFAYEGERVVGLEGAGGERIEADYVVSAVPLEVLARWLRPEAATAELTRVGELRSAPMSSIQLIYDGRLSGVPEGVFYLWGSEPPINAIDLSQTWRGLADSGRTAISTVVSDHISIRGLQEDRLAELVIEQLAKYIPDARRVAPVSVAVCANVAEPLFINTAGSWRLRPRPAQPYAGGRLYVTGDFAQNAVDLACMEGAVLSASLTARAIADRASRRPGLSPILPEGSGLLRRAAYRGAKAGVAPLTAVGRLTQPQRRSR